MEKSCWIVVDVETDGPVPALFSMVSLGAVVLSEKLDRTFHACFAPISEQFIPEALAISGHTREAHLKFPDALSSMKLFAQWVDEQSKGRHPVFVSDNPAFDWQFVNYYFHYFIGRNPFGFSARRIGDLYCGMKMDISKNNEWKTKFRKTTHTHNPLDDALGNAEALLAFGEQFGLNIPLYTETHS